MEKRFTFIELISLIIIIAFIVIIAISCALPKTDEAREKAFRVEATKIVEAAEQAVNKSKEGSLEINNDAKSCKKNNMYCFSVSELINKQLYSGSSSNYSGKIIIDYEDENKPGYSVYFKKNDEFKIIGGFRSSYIDFGVLSVQMWNDDYETCNCD